MSLKMLVQYSRFLEGLLFTHGLTQTAFVRAVTPVIVLTKLAHLCCAMREATVSNHLLHSFTHTVMWISGCMGAKTSFQNLSIHHAT